jgi:hypothetical protein
MKERNYLEDLGVDRMIILKLILNKYGVRIYTEFFWVQGWAPANIINLQVL